MADVHAGNALEGELVRWPWQKRERRDSGGDFSDAVVRLIEAQASGSAGGCQLYGGCRGR